MPWRPLAACVLLTVLPSCADDGSTTPRLADGAATDSQSADSAPITAAPSPEVRQACEVFSRAFCARLEACAPVDLANIYGGSAGCLELDRLRCEAVAGLSGAAGTAAVRAAAESLSATRCSQLAGWEHDPTYGTPGTHPAGRPCTRREQCASGYCAPPATPASPGCGVCRDQTPVDSACHTPPANADICEGIDLYCDVYHHCARVSGPDGPCGVCEEGLLCDGGVCREPLPAGAACDPNGFPCSFRAGLACHPEKRTCEPAPVREVGQSCEGAPSAGACAPGLACIFPDGVFPGMSSQPGRCAPRLGLGGTCGAGNPCVLALDCRAGLCQPQFRSVCGPVPLAP